VNVTGPLEILVTIVLLLIVVGCVAICVVAVRWLRRIGLQVEEEQARRREREDAVAAREAEAAARQVEAAERERDRAAAEDDRLQAEHRSAEDLRQIWHRAALADEEAAQAKAEAARAEAEAARAEAEAAAARTEEARARAEAARAQLELTQIRIESEKAHVVLLSAQTDVACEQAEALRSQDVRAQRSQEPAAGDEGDEAHDLSTRAGGASGSAASGGAASGSSASGGMSDLVPGEVADLLRHLGLPTGWGEGSRTDDVSVQGIDPRMLRRLQGLIPPEVMRRLSSGRGPGDIESIGDWIRSQIEKSMQDGREEPGRGRRHDRPAGFQRTDTPDEDPAVSEDVPEVRDVSDGRPDARADDLPDVRAADLPDDLADDLSGVASDSATAASGGLDVAALIEEALRDRDRWRNGEERQNDTAEPDGAPAPDGDAENDDSAEASNDAGSGDDARADDTTEPGTSTGPDDDTRLDGNTGSDDRGQTPESDED
jgi:hypothetical protein